MMWILTLGPWGALGESDRTGTQNPSKVSGQGPGSVLSGPELWSCFTWFLLKKTKTK